MVKTELSHFGDVVAACRALAEAGLRPVPHVPCARFGTAQELHEVLASLADAGVRDLLVIGGNDLAERRVAGGLAYQSAEALLEEEAPRLRQRWGFASVALAGHPEGLPVPSGEAAAASALRRKASTLLGAGLDVVVAAQFCFSPTRLLSWLRSTRGALTQVAAAQAGRAPRHSAPRVGIHVGLPGPTPQARLQRIASICGVSPGPLPSSFELAAAPPPGGVAAPPAVGLRELVAAADDMGLRSRGEQLEALFAEHAGHRGALCRAAFARLLVRDSEAPEPPGWSGTTPTAPSSKVVGPSASIVAEGGGTEAGPLWPEEAALVLAAYCEREGLREDELAIHLYPFGGLPASLDCLAQLREGRWPPPGA